MRTYILAKRGLNALGGVEMIYKTNISCEGVNGSQIANLSRIAEHDLDAAIGLSEGIHPIILTDQKDGTLSVLLRTKNPVGDVCRIFETYIEAE